MTDFDNSWQALLQPHLSLRFFDRNPLPRFEPAENFSIPLAWWMAGLCQASYLSNGIDSQGTPDAKIRHEVLVSHGFMEQAFIDKGPIQAVLVAREKTCVLAFRGTDDPDDWQTNIRIRAAKWPGGGLVHRGFLEAFEAVVPTIATLRRRFAEQRWFLTGHSQGAAIAILAITLVRPVSVYAFGCPRMADRCFAMQLESTPVHQVINDRDIVTRLPPGNAGFDACLPGQIYHLLKGSIARPEDETDLQPMEVGKSLMEHLKMPGDWGLPIKELSDHAIVNYLAALERIQ